MASEPDKGTINLIEVCEHWKDLPHQNGALDLLQKNTPPLVLDAFTEAWRRSPASTNLQPANVVTLPPPNPATNQRPEIHVPGLGARSLDDRIDGSIYFRWAEATKSGARIPADERIARNIIALAVELDELRAYLGVPLIITSWYRPPAVNRAVGGVPNSTHISGHAADFRPASGMNVHEAQRQAEGFWNSRGGVGFGANRGFVHVDLRNKLEGRGAARWDY